MFDIKKFRKSRGLTQRELASILKVTQQSIYNWEKGLRTPPPLIIDILEKMEKDGYIHDNKSFTYISGDNSTSVSGYSNNVSISTAPAKKEQDVQYDYEKTTKKDNSSKITQTVINDLREQLQNKDEQLKEKDAQIERLMQQVDKLLEMLSKKN